MPGKDELDSLKDAETSLQALKAEAESDEIRLDTAEHKRLLRLVKARMACRITEEQFWDAIDRE
jgi:hypothetical protein